MLYESDFLYQKRQKPNKELNRWAFDIARQQSNFNVDLAQNIYFNKDKKLNGPKPLIRPWSKAHQRENKKLTLTKALRKVFCRFCDNTTIHGVKYFGLKDQHWSERVIFIILVTAGMVGAGYISYYIQQRFSGTPLATVIGFNLAEESRSP